MITFGMDGHPTVGGRPSVTFGILGRRLRVSFGISGRPIIGQQQNRRPIVGRWIDEPLN